MTKELDIMTTTADLAFRFVIGKLRTDQTTVEVVDAFTRRGIDVLVLKGPTLAEWLYPEEVRIYSDSDLMVGPARRSDAVEVLERLGFRTHCPWLPSPLSLDPGGTAFERGDDMVDLHCVIPGLHGDPTVIWADLIAKAEPRTKDGVELRVPDQDTLLLHVAVHAGHHANDVGCKAFDDLRRAIVRADEQHWRHALELARAYDGVPAFVAGLNGLAEGRNLMRQLEPGDVSSFRYSLRREDNVIAEEIAALFSSEASLRHRFATVASELFPSPEYMRWWSPWARRGPLGLTLAYIGRPLWAIAQLPRAISALWRVRQTINGDRHPR